MLLLLHKTLKSSLNIQGFALIRAVLFSIYFSLEVVHLMLLFGVERLFKISETDGFKDIDGNFESKTQEEM